MGLAGVLRQFGPHVHLAFSVLSHRVWAVTTGTMGPFQEAPLKAHATRSEFAGEFRPILNELFAQIDIDLGRKLTENWPALGGDPGRSCTWFLERFLSRCVWQPSGTED